MATTADLVHVIEAVGRAGAKVVLVGDPCQLPEIGPGGGLAAAVGLLGSDVCELTLNRRQQQAWEIEALDQLRHGDPEAAWHAYRDHDRVVLADEPEVLHRRAVDDWWHSHTTGGYSFLSAGTRVEVSVLNRLARQRVAEEGGLTGPPLAVGEADFRVGDRVLCTRNGAVRTHDGRVMTIDNGTVGTVIAIHHDLGSLTVRTIGRSRDVHLDAAYLREGHLQHGYATTIHKAQGATCDHVHLVGRQGCTGKRPTLRCPTRHGALLYATTSQAAELDTGSHAPASRSPPTNATTTTASCSSVSGSPEPRRSSPSSSPTRSLSPHWPTRTSPS